MRLVVAGAAALAMAGGGAGLAQASTTMFSTFHVGQATSEGTVLNDDQFAKPIGDRLTIDNGKIMSSAVSPDGTHLAALNASWGHTPAIALTIVNLNTYKVQQTAGSDGKEDLEINTSDVGQEGPAYSPDGRSLWMPQENGYTKFTVNSDGSLANPAVVGIAAEGSKRALAAQAVFSADGSTVYGALNGQNRVVAINASTGAIEQSWDVGNAPRDMVRIGDKIYVSDEGGRPATTGDTTMNSYGTQMVADPTTSATTTGTVSVIDTATPTSPVTSINVGLHPTALYASNGVLFVTDTGSDQISIIDTAKDAVTQTISTRPWPTATVGYEPDGVTLTQDGHLLVTLGRANAVAVYQYTKPLQPVSYVGLLPTDYFPENIATVGDKVVVTNLRGIEDRITAGTVDKGPGTTPASGYFTHNATGTLTRFSLPDDVAIRTKLTAQVFAQNGWTNNDVNRAEGSKAKPVPVPARLGDPSTIKHVFMFIKENRTYDQVLGDDPRGNGDPSLAQFGEHVTPNQHQMAKQFGLYDNFYDPATNSSEGHDWLLQSDDPEYMESQAGAYQRSYGIYSDALGAQRSGFIWNGAKAAGKSTKIYGELANSIATAPNSTWQNWYCDAKNMEATGQATAYPTYTYSDIPSQDAVQVRDYPNANLNVPDQYRYQMWKQDFEKNGPADFNLFWLPRDHTSGNPTNPIAEVADNDLALGKFVDTISHSKYWKDSAIFVVEDDTQDGVDHVDGTRGPIQIISPWAQHGAVDHHYYTEITMMRTIEQILGIQPMNQKDSAATPMYGAFTSKPDNQAYTAVPNQVPLTYGMTTPPSCGYDQVPAKDLNAVQAESPASAPAAEAQTAATWKQWAKHQPFTGVNAKVDAVAPELMNRYTWYEEYNFTKPYPGDTKILTPNQVPGGAIPGNDSDG